MSKLPWSERVPLFSIHPEAASPEDISRLASELMESRHSEFERIKSQQGQEDCLWEYDDVHGKYDTACGNAYCFIAGERRNQFRYCPYCGRKIEENAKN